MVLGRLTAGYSYMAVSVGFWPLASLNWRVEFALWLLISFFFFNDTATTEIYTLSLHDALPISSRLPCPLSRGSTRSLPHPWCLGTPVEPDVGSPARPSARRNGLKLVLRQRVAGRAREIGRAHV